MYEHYGALIYKLLREQARMKKDKEENRQGRKQTRKRKDKEENRQGRKLTTKKTDKEENRQAREKTRKKKDKEERLEKLGLETLTSRREILCLNFALKCTKNEKLKHMFPKNDKKHNWKHEMKMYSR